MKVGPVQRLYPVLEELNPEMVITSNLMNLKHGMPVQINPPSPSRPSDLNDVALQ